MAVSTTFVIWVPSSPRSRQPRNLASYGEPDAAALAASYAFDFARSHGFADGNKRTAWVLARVFLADNGYRLRLDLIDAIGTIESLAAGTLSEEDLATWFRAGLKP
jgi:death-on-curing protein